MEKTLRVMWGRMWEMHQQAKNMLFFSSHSTANTQVQKKQENIIQYKEPSRAPKSSPAQRIGLLLGPLLFLVILLFVSPDGMSKEAVAVLASTVWIATWWVTEAVPIPVASLLPIILFPLTGAVEGDAVMTPYADSIIFLFIGGFMIAIAIEKWNLHRRIALSIILMMGTNTERLVLGFIAATGFLSMWISNTATAMMMVPIALAVTSQAKESMRQDQEKMNNFVKATMLGVMYAASIGGLGTLIGTPANMVLASTVKNLYNIDLSFFTWMMFAIPLVVVILSVAWLFLVKVAFPQEVKHLPSGKAVMEKEKKLLGKPSFEEKLILAVFLFTAFCWVTRTFLLTKWFPTLNDTIIAITAGLLLFLLPAKSGQSARLLVWEDARKIPWGILLLFGGGSSIGDAFQSTGLSKWIGQQMTVLDGMNFAIVIVAVIVLVIVLSEFTSNVATSIMLLPVMASLAVALEVHPYSLLFAAGVATSCAFILPTAATPNTITFATGKIKLWDMMRSGIWMNLFCIVIVTLMVLYFMPIVWDIDMTSLPESMRK